MEQIRFVVVVLIGVGALVL